jgi:tRNA pseudouridine55 synthase
MENIQLYNFQAGEILLFDKPPEWTSFDVVNKVRRTISRVTGIKRIKVGHAGTLDPLATGLLILCTGKFTKKIQEFQDFEKEYTGTIVLGATTPSLDAETEISESFPVEHIDSDLIKQTIKDNFLGVIKQIPPAYSAIKVRGTRAYHMARKEGDVQLSPREVEIFDFEVSGFRLPEIDFRIVCSKGTYIRSLARDLGKALQSGGYLGSLRRTKIGEYCVTEALSIEEFVSALQENKLKNTDYQKNSK